MTEILTACLLYHHAERLSSVNMVDEAKTTKLRTIVDLLTEMEESAKNFSFQPHVGFTGASGRPKIRVTKEQLTCRVDNGFKGTDMTCMLSISQATLNRWRILTLKFHIHFQPSTMIIWMVLFEVKKRSSLTVAIEWFGVI